MLLLLVSTSAWVGATPVTDYGSFTANTSSVAVVAQNNATINRAIVQLGQTGGGVVDLPEGVYYIGPDPAVSDRAITINYDNITIQGAGVGRTILKTNGIWNTANTRRGYGIIVEGGSNPTEARRNIVLRDFELDGQAGWTGDYYFPADPVTGVGWDITHKGIVPSWDAFGGGVCDNILLENLYVHHYSGEILYCGGYGMGKLTVRNVKLANTNGSDFNLWAADLLVEDCEFAGPSRFWIEYSPRRNQSNFPVNRAVFRRNRFHNAVTPAINEAQIAFAQGDGLDYEVLFENNDFRNCPDVFAFYGGVGGPVTVHNNTFADCGTTLSFGYAPGYINTDDNTRIVFENNRIERGQMLAYFFARVSAVTVRDNVFIGKDAADLGQSTALFYGAGNFNNTNIERNIFTDCRTPEQTADIEGQRPLFRDNRYLNVERRFAQGQFPTTYYPVAVPHHEAVHIPFTDVDGTIVALERALYPDGQILWVTGGSPTLRPRFATDQASYFVAADRYLDGSTALRFRYAAATARWIEAPPSAWWSTTFLAFPDPGFESETPGWNFYNSYVVLGSARSGKFATRHGAGEAGMWTTTRTLQPATTYRVSAWVQAPADQPAPYLYVKNHGGPAVGDVPFASTGQWTHQVAVFTTGAGAENTRAEFGVWRDSGEGNVFIDDFTLTPATPLAPTTFGSTPESAGTIRLTWSDAPDDTSSYILETRIADENGAPWLPLATPAAGVTSYLHSGLAPGSRQAYRLTAVNSYGSSTALITSTQVWTEIETWRHGIWGSALPVGSTANLADPDGDGIVNLIEYALAGNPLVSTPTNSLFQVTLAEPSGRLALTFVRHRTDLVYTVQASANMQNWHDLETPASPVGASITVIDPTVLIPSRFLRIRVRPIATD